MKRISCLILYILLSSNLFANTDKLVESQGDITQLSYGWHPDISAEVKYKRVETKSMTGKEDSIITMNGAYLLRTKKHQKGLEIVFDEIHFDFYDTTGSVLNNKMQQFIQELMGISPSYIIDQEGYLIEITKFDKFQKKIKKEMLAFFDDAPEEELTKIQQFVNSIFSKEQLLMQIDNEWNRDVGQWIGAELEQGYTYEVEFTRAIPMLGNLEVPNKGSYEFLERVPCDNLDSNKACVKLSFFSAVDENATQPILEQMMRNMGVEDETTIKALSNIGMKIDYSLEIITEEKSLLPFYVKEIKKTTVPNPETGHNITKDEISEYRYKYVRR